MVCFWNMFYKLLCSGNKHRTNSIRPALRATSYFQVGERRNVPLERLALPMRGRPSGMSLIASQLQRNRWFLADETDHRLHLPTF